MQKFTIFSGILAAVVMLFVTQSVATEYFPSWNDTVEEIELTGEVNVFNNKLGSDSDFAVADDIVNDPVEIIDEQETIVEENLIAIENDLADDVSFSSGFDPLAEIVVNESSSDFEDLSYVVSNSNVYLREEQVRSAGFARAYIVEEAHNGYFFKNIFVKDLDDVTLRKFTVRDASLLYVKVYVFSPGTIVNLDQLYNVLKSRADETLSSNINETNQFAGASFYMNDSSRENTAFLTVKFNGLIYGFSYPKDYHTQVTNLIKLIGLER